MLSEFERQTLAEVIENVFKDGSLESLDILVTETDQHLSVKVIKMYEHVSLTFASLEALAEIFGTKDFTVDNWSARGCETCDFGSSYTHEFSVKKG